MPCRCLLSELPDRKAADIIRDYIDTLPEAIRVTPAEYARRLSLCRLCENLIDGTCRLCGCYVEARAMKAPLSCPAVPARWHKLADS